MDVTAAQVRAFRVRAQQLDRPTGSVADTRVLDLGVQDARADGVAWNLAVRGVDGYEPDELALLWAWRGAPHAFRRADLSAVGAALRPFSEADAAKRIFDAAKPLKAAGIAVLDALDEIAAKARELVRRPTVKGALSAALTAELPEPYRRWCNPCQAVHLFEQPFRLGVARAGLELEPDTSPPVLRRVPRWTPRAAVPPRFDPVRAYLALFGPATPAEVVWFLDAPLKDVRARWPGDAVEVTIDGSRAWLLESDLDALAAADPGAMDDVRLLGPADPFLRARDRDVLVGDDAARQKELWPTIGRPGAVLVGAEVVGSWRARTGRGGLTVTTSLWGGAPRRAVADQAERLAAARGLELAAVE